MEAISVKLFFISSPTVCDLVFGIRQTLTYWNGTASVTKLYCNNKNLIKCFQRFPTQTISHYINAIWEIWFLRFYFFENFFQRERNRNLEKKFSRQIFPEIVTAVLLCHVISRIKFLKLFFLENFIWEIFLLKMFLSKLNILIRE